MHEGELIKKLLKNANKKPADLARACDVTPGAVTKYLKPATIGDRAWKNVRQGLEVLGIDWRQIRDEPATLYRERTEDLRPKVIGFDHKQLEVVQQILKAGERSREALLFWLDGKLSPKH